MGCFYTNLVLRGPEQTAVVEFLNRQERSTYVAPDCNGCVVVFDEESEGQDGNVLDALGMELSKAFGCPVLAALNHDEDLLWYRLYQAGVVEDHYVSNPGLISGNSDDRSPAGGDAAKLCKAFGASEAEKTVSTILNKPIDSEDGYIFASDRHRELCDAIDIPDFVASLGFCYIRDDDPDELKEVLGIDVSSFVKTGP